MRGAHELSRTNEGVLVKNLDAFKELIERYTIADLRSMVYDVEDKPSGGCCYSAVQTLFSLIEMLGKLLRQNTSDEDAFAYVFTKLGAKYNDEQLAKDLYNHFRHGIAHTSLARGGVRVKKSGDRSFHLSANGNNLDIRLFFEDFLPVFNEFFDVTLCNPNHTSQYEQNLRDIFSDLRIPWQQQYQVAEGDLDVSANYTRTDITISGTRLRRALNSCASETRLSTKLSTGESKTQLVHKCPKSPRFRKDLGKGKAVYCNSNLSNPNGIVTTVNTEKVFSRYY